MFVTLGDMAGSILYSANGSFGIKDEGAGRNLFNTPVRGGDQGSIPIASNKRQRVPYNPTKLATMEVSKITFFRFFTLFLKFNYNYVNMYSLTCYAWIFWLYTNLNAWKNVEDTFQYIIGIDL